MPPASYPKYTLPPPTGDPKTSTLAATNASPYRPLMFIHTVYFWLKPTAPANAQAQLLADCRNLLGQIESVRTLHAGLPVPSDRAVVDSSYAVGLTVIFDNAAGHDVYQPHPLHQQFIARNKDNWDRVVVYDFTH